MYSKRLYFSDSNCSQYPNVRYDNYISSNTELSKLTTVQYKLFGKNNSGTSWKSVINI